MKKIVSLVLCVVMALGLMACGNGNNSSSTTAGKETEKKSTEAVTTAAGATDETTATQGQEGEGEPAASAIDFDEEPYTLNVCYAVMGQAQPDLAMIEEKLNEITLKEINAKVKLEAVSLFSLANVYALKASGQEKTDLMLLFPGSQYLTSFANSNLIMPIEEYVDQWGGALKEGLGEMLDAGKYKGHQYAIPQNSSVRKSAWGIKLSDALCEKHNIKPEEIKTLEDLEAAFAIIKENEPDVTVFMPETTGQGIAGSFVDYYDTCGTGGGILQVQTDGSLKIMNQLDDPEYVAMCEKVHEWYEKGYISKDVLTNQEDGNQVLQAGRCFALAASSINPNMGDKFSTWIILNENKPLLTTTDDQLILWSVASSCQRPDKAVQFINMCFENADVENLMRFGVEDVHYTKLENGSVNADNNANWQNWWNMFGDYRKQYVVDTELALTGMTSIEEYKDLMASWETVLSPAYGFNFDPTNVKTQIAACDAVNNEFMLTITNGTVDPATEIGKWKDKLVEAGIDDVIAEKQNQLDEWLAAK